MMREILEIQSALNTFDKYLREQLREATDKNVAIYEHWCDCSGDIEKVIEKINGGPIKNLLPAVTLYQTVYVVTRCSEISSVLDGSLYGSNGGPGSATGYYCPFEDNCPFEDCGQGQGYNNYAVFATRAIAVIYNEDGIYITPEHCKLEYNQLGRDVFLTEEAAKAALPSFEEAEAERIRECEEQGLKWEGRVAYGGLRK